MSKNTPKKNTAPIAYLVQELHNQGVVGIEAVERASELKNFTSVKPTKIEPSKLRGYSDIVTIPQDIVEESTKRNRARGHRPFASGKRAREDEPDSNPVKARKTKDTAIASEHPSTSIKSTQNHQLQNLSKQAQR